MKPEIDINLKARFYAQYIGQKVIEGSDNEMTMWDLPALVLSGIPLSLKKLDRNDLNLADLKLNGYATHFEFLTTNDLVYLGWVKIVEK